MSYGRGIARTRRRNVRVEFQEGLEDRPKRAAWITPEGRHAMGQLTLWESGECETEAVGTTSVGEQGLILLRSRVLSDASLVPAVADDLVDHIADYSGD
jgi:hypothetical protein